MLSAFIRLGWITALTVILTFFAVFLVRWMGYQQAFATPPHPWFEKPRWSILSPPPEVVCGAAYQGPAEHIIRITTRFVDGHWRLDCPQNGPTLAAFLSAQTAPDWILKVVANDSTHLDQLVKDVGAFDRIKKFAIQADSQRVSRFLRKKSPQWVYAADPASVLRLTLFTGMWIETAMDFWPDFVLATGDRAHQISDRMALELTRRQKRIIWDDEQNSPTIPVHGSVTTRPM